MKQQKTLPFLVLITSCCAPLIANASSMPAANANATLTDFNYISGTGGNIPFDTTVSWTGTDGFAANFTATSGPVPSLTVDANSPLFSMYGGTLNTQLSANLVYYFSVSGPDTSIIVPISITGSYSNQLTGYSGNVTTEIVAFDANSTVNYNFLSSCSGVCLGDVSNGIFSGNFNMHADGTYETLALGIGMILSTGYLSNGQSSNTAASAYIDPFIQVDPNWALSHPGHSIIVSNGIGNAAPAAVPVPGALWLFASGLMGLLGLRRRGNNS